EHGHSAHPVRAAALPPGPRSPGRARPRRPRSALRPRHARPFPRYGTGTSDIGGMGRRVQLARRTPPPDGPEAPPPDGPEAPPPDGPEAPPPKVTIRWS